MRFIQVISWVPLHVRTCTSHLRISRTNWPIVLKFDVWLENQLWWGLQKSEVGWLHIHVRLQFRYLGNLWAVMSPVPEAAPKTGLSLSRSLVHRQTWRLTGTYSYVCTCGHNIIHTYLMAWPKNTWFWPKIQRILQQNNLRYSRSVGSRYRVIGKI